MYTKEEINQMSVEEARAALWAAQLSVKAGECAAEPLMDVLQAEQGPVTSFTKNFLIKHQVSPQIAGAIAVSAIGGFLEIMKALLLLLLR